MVRWIGKRQRQRVLCLIDAYSLSSLTLAPTSSPKIENPPDGVNRPGGVFADTGCTHTSNLPTMKSVCVVLGLRKFVYEQIAPRPAPIGIADE